MSLELILIIGTLLHFVGDYILQSDWMALNKTSKWLPAIAHGLTYGLPFLFITQNPFSLLIIAGTHVLIDHWRLAKYLVWLKNFIGPPGANKPWIECNKTGYPNDRPEWLTTWLLFITDNTLHVAINTATLILLG